MRDELLFDQQSVLKVVLVFLLEVVIYTFCLFVQLLTTKKEKKKKKEGEVFVVVSTFFLLSFSHLLIQTTVLQYGIQCDSK